MDYVWKSGGPVPDKLNVLPLETVPTILIALNVDQATVDGFEVSFHCFLVQWQLFSFFTMATSNYFYLFTIKLYKNEKLLFDEGYYQVYLEVNCLQQFLYQ